MRPLSLLAWGLLVVIVDIRVETFDVVPDVVGWAMMALALGALRRRHTGFQVALVAALLGLLGSFLAEIVLPAVGGSGAVGPDADGWVWTTLEAVLLTVMVFAVCTAIRTFARAAGDSRRASSANAVRWLDVAVLVGLPGFTGGAADSVGHDLALGLALVLVALALLSMVTAVWFLVLLFGGRKAPYLQRDPIPEPR